MVGTCTMENESRVSWAKSQLQSHKNSSVANHIVKEIVVMVAPVQTSHDYRNVTETVKDKS